jgi:transcriptional regulator with XRE-family HTH domain
MKKDETVVAVGKRLKALRKKLGMTLDDLGEKANLSRSYLSEFERGVKLPTSRHMMWLHKTFRVNLNYLYLSDDEMFLEPEARQEEILDFGTQKEYVDDMLRVMADIPHALFFMLGHFQQYKMEYRKLVDDFYRQRKKTEER